MNRIGDFGFLCGLLCIFYLFRTIDFSIVFAIAPFFCWVNFALYPFTFSFLDLVCFFLFIGSCGKSAQLGLHT
jgi:NADH-quinone oxidoreductase subunit L